MSTRTTFIGFRITERIRSSRLSALLIRRTRPRPSSLRLRRRGARNAGSRLRLEDRSVEDYEGEELPDKHAAWREATITAGQILQGLDGDLGNGGWW
jgi:hypothetical protein